MLDQKLEDDNFKRAVLNEFAPEILFDLSSSGFVCIMDSGDINS